MIVRNKALRSSFSATDLPEVRRYCDAELVNLVRLMVELRARLNKCGLRPKRWDGPGAIASALLQREKVRDAQAECPPPVAEAARYAYAGGRFEVIKYGHSDAPAYEYDINSAYPSAMRFLPDLTEGKWERVTDWQDETFTVYHLRYANGPSTVPGPLFRRSANGTICYPQNVTGWYWGPEAECARDYVRLHGGSLDLLEAWTYRRGNRSPFSFVEPLYVKRQALKKAGDGAHVGIKLGLNSLYGKLAQQVGWKPATYKRPQRIPPFHQLEYAGYVTAHARATVLRAVLHNLTDVIAFETDAIFTTTPLALPLGPNLGEFEATEFLNLTYLQSGLYFGDLVGGGSVSKTRGVDRGTLTRENTTERLGLDASHRFVSASLTRFVGAGIALTQNFARWRTWETMPKNVSLFPMGKRAHFSCVHCTDATGLTPGWHLTECPFLDDAHSTEFPVEWINPNPAMTELREENYERDFDNEQA